jgi:tetratricopeptide (TPR) repeat protein
MRPLLPAIARTVAVLCGLFVLGGLAAGPGARADDGMHRRLVDQAIRLLKDAERHRNAGREGQALDGARRALAIVDQADRQKPGAAETAFLGVQAAVFAKDRAAARLWAARFGQRSAYGDKDPNLHYAHALVWLLIEERPGDAVRSLDEMAKVSRGGLSRAGNVLLYDALTANGERLLRRARVYDAVAQFERASKVARRLQNPPKEKTARANGAIALLEFGHAEDAEKLLASLRKDDPQNPLWAWHLAQSLMLQERFEEAGPLFEEVCKFVDQRLLKENHAPMLKRAYLGLGRVWRETAKQESEPSRRTAAIEKARVAFQRFTHISPTVGEGWFRLGRLLYEDLDEPYAAIEKLEKAYVLEPVCDQAIRLLIRIAGRHEPPPATGAETPAEVRREWDERRADWEKALDAHADEWEAERQRRREASPRGEDGCPR